jgi:hypothetical protein
MTAAEGFIIGLLIGIFGTVFLVCAQLLLTTPALWRRPPARPSSKHEPAHPAPPRRQAPEDDGKIIALTSYARKRRTE